MCVGCSLKLGNGVAIALEGSVGDICAHIYKVGHNGLVGGAVPLYVARLSEPISVHIFVVLVEHGLLMVHPLFVRVGHGRVSWQNSEQNEVGHIGVVHQRAHVPVVIVQHNRTVASQTSAHTADQEVRHPPVHQSSSHVKVTDRKFTDEQKASFYTIYSNETSNIFGYILDSSLKQLYLKYTPQLKYIYRNSCLSLPK